MNTISEILRNISRLAELDSSLVENVSRQLCKLAELRNNNIDIFLTQSIKALTQYPNYKSNLIDSISDGQNLSKNWLIEELDGRNLGNVILCAGWYAMLLIDQRLKFSRCVNVDVDPICESVSKILHKHLVIDNWKFQAITKNIHDINYSKHVFSVTRNDGSTAEFTMIPDTIINTSCEHINNFSEWYNLIPNNKLIILQSNNGFDIPDHVNCVNSLVDFEKQTPMHEVLYSGERKMPKFTRYMRIGFK